MQVLVVLAVRTHFLARPVYRYLSFVAPMYERLFILVCYISYSSAGLALGISCICHRKGRTMDRLTEICSCYVTVIVSLIKRWTNNGIPALSSKRVDPHKPDYPN